LYEKRKERERKRWEREKEKGRESKRERREIANSTFDLPYVTNQRIAVSQKSKTNQPIF
jgi:hypothetical protein